MVDDDGGSQLNDVTSAGSFFVRLGNNDEAPFAVCNRTGTVNGNDVVPGLGKTVAELVAEQALLAAAIPRSAQDDLQNLSEIDATGENLPSGGSVPGGGGGTGGG